ncbi:MAG: 8-oxoguanine deaminase [Candidatus Eremiobacteraeota bacterium]|nr:8-oxoguanine deaminase [Candidatus Eremiobacteraeota bacterium]
MNRLFIKNADFIITMNDDQEILKNENILIEGNKIKEISGAIIPGPDDEVIDATGSVVMPGMVNTHHHLYQSMNRNVPRVANFELFDWLSSLYEIWRELDPEWVRISTLVGLGELLLTGCTLSSDMFYVFPRSAPSDLFDYEVEAAKEIGIRFHPCRGSMSRGKSQGGLPPDDVVQTEEEIFSDYERVIKKYHDPSPFSMCRIALGPCSPFSVTTALMKETVRFARKHGVLSHTHLAETKDEEEYCLKIYNKRPLHFMRDLEWEGEDVWFAHCIHLDDEEINLMGETRSGVAHCPVSNMRLGSGIAPVPELLKAGAKISLGVDGSASNDSGDMWGEARNCLLVHRLKGGAKAITAEQVLRIATRGGAEVLGWDEIGMIERGKAADLVIINLQKIGFAGGLFEPVGALLLTGDSHVVDYTIVNGKVVVRRGKLVNVNEEELVEQAKTLSFKKLKEAGKRTGIDFFHKG